MTTTTRPTDHARAVADAWLDELDEAFAPVRAVAVTPAAKLTSDLVLAALDTPVTLATWGWSVTMTTNRRGVMVLRIWRSSPAGQLDATARHTRLLSALDECYRQLRAQLTRDWPVL